MSRGRSGTNVSKVVWDRVAPPRSEGWEGMNVIRFRRQAGLGIDMSGPNLALCSLNANSVRLGAKETVWIPKPPRSHLSNNADGHGKDYTPACKLWERGAGPM